MDADVDEDEDDEDREEDNIIFSNGSQNQSFGDKGLSNEATVGTIVALLLSIFLCINCSYCCIHARRKRQAVSDSGDPYGTTATVTELYEGRVLVKKVIPQLNGKSKIVQKAIYPNQQSAAKVLKGYHHV
jgi:hypothetical protein